jgi:hypothetical protein
MRGRVGLKPEQTKRSKEYSVKMLALGHHAQSHQSHGCENHESQSTGPTENEMERTWKKNYEMHTYISLEDLMKTDLIGDLCRYPRILLKWILD